MITDKSKEFSEALLKWRTPRDFPWRETSSPYLILIAELLLQRTRADQVAAIYKKFIAKWPDVKSLACSDLAKVHALIKPLGLDYRANRIIEIARQINSEQGGAISHDPFLRSNYFGIGKYVKNAVLCFGFGDRVAIVDSNVVRIFRRVFSLRLDPNSHKKEKVWNFAKNLVPSQTNIKNYNWRLLDLGALFCTPKKPRCVECPLQEICDYGRKRVPATTRSADYN